MADERDNPRDGRSIRRAPVTGEVVNAPNRSPRFRGDRDENPSPEDIERLSGVTRKCRECGQEVFDDSAVCYHCGHAFEGDAAGSGGVPKWAVWVVVAIVAAVAIAMALRII